MIDVVKCGVNENVNAYGKELGFSRMVCGKCVEIKEGGSDEQNRKFVSDKRNDILMNPELKCVGDKVHYRRSGLNQVLAKLAVKNDVAIGFGFGFVLDAVGWERGRILGRMKQNVRICRKAGVKMVVCSYAGGVKGMRGAKDLVAFARVLGMDGDEAKKALNWKRNEKSVRVVE
tara:strand:+ start:254 stop:775 length:522 start_codon:yes stop_codon:yes gene_type:complete